MNRNDWVIGVLREVIRSLEAWDRAARCQVTIRPGEVLSGCRIQFNGLMHADSAVEPYVMEFHCSGREYLCPLYRFQSRTQVLELVSLEGAPAPVRRTHATG